MWRVVRRGSAVRKRPGLADRRVRSAAGASPSVRGADGREQIDGSMTTFRSVRHSFITSVKE
jgi:hypothetical protein